MDGDIRYGQRDVDCCAVVDWASGDADFEREEVSR